MPNSTLIIRYDAVFAVLFLLLGASSVLADELDTWNVLIGSSVTHDSNLFRLSESSDTQALLGTSKRSDTIFTNNLGVKIQKPYSLQRFELDINLTDYRYKTFDYLDYTAKNYSAAWRWSLTPDLRGNLSIKRQQSLNNYSDYQNYDKQNLRTEEERRFDADLDVGAGWHVSGGVFESTRKNSAQFIEEGDTALVSSEAGLRHVFTSGASVGYLNRIGRGSYENRPQPISNRMLDNKYSQVDNELTFKWPITAKSTLDARIGWRERNHEHYSARDYSGLIGKLNLDWNISAKTRLTGEWNRELSSYQSQLSSYWIADRFTVSPIWQISAKTALRLRYDYIRRNYRAAVIASSLSDRRDNQHTGLIAFDWQPMTSLSLSASVSGEKNSSNQPNGGYKDTVGAINAQLSF